MLSLMLVCRQCRRVRCLLVPVPNDKLTPRLIPSHQLLLLLMLPYQVTNIPQHKTQLLLLSRYSSHRSLLLNRLLKMLCPVNLPAASLLTTMMLMTSLRLLNHPRYTHTHQSCSQYSTSQVPVITSLVSVQVPVFRHQVPVLESQVPVPEIDIMFLIKMAKVEVNNALPL